MRETQTMPAMPIRRRRWLRYSVRSLLLLMLAVSIFFAWLAPQLRRAAAQRAVVAEIREAGGTVLYDAELPARQSVIGAAIVSVLLGRDSCSGPFVVCLMDSTTTDDDVAVLARLTDVSWVQIGGQGVTDGCVDDLLRMKSLNSLGLHGTSITPDGLNRLATPRQGTESQGLYALSLSGTGVTDAHMRVLPQFGFLEILSVRRSSVTDSGIESLKTVANLRDLCLSGSRITDAGVVHLAGCKHLLLLDLSGTAVGDKSLEVISGIPWLEMLNLSGTKVSDAGLVHLQKKMILSKIDLSQTAITDAGLAHLRRLSLLRDVHLTLGKGITQEGVARLQADLPQYRVNGTLYAPIPSNAAPDEAWMWR